MLRILDSYWEYTVNYYLLSVNCYLLTLLKIIFQNT